MRDKIEKICRDTGSKVFFDEDLSKHTTIALGGSCPFWIEPLSNDALNRILKVLSGETIAYKVIGEGSNILFPDNGVKDAFIRLDEKGFNRIEASPSDIRVSSGMKLSVLLSECAKEGLSGFEGMIGIPGTVGGALVMNASYKGAISDHLTRVLVMDPSGETKWIDKENITFGYRSASFNKGDIILEAVFALIKDSSENIISRMTEYFSGRLDKQPLGEKSLGCVFKNPEKCDKSSWELIDAAGMRGRSIGGAKISEKHANFIINENAATSKDVITLIEEVKSAVREKSGIELELEIEIL